MAGTMTNDEIMSEFEELFGTGDSPDEEDKPDTDTSADESEDKPEDVADETKSDEEEKSEEESEEEEPEESKDTTDKKGGSSSRDKQSKQNYAFAELRNQNKQNEQFIRGLGKLVGLDNNASVDDIKDKIKEVLIAKEAKDNNISIELAKRLDAYESDKQELERVKLEKKVQDDFAELIDKHNLDEAAVNEFTAYLIANGKNPMLGQTVDLEAEYLKLHYDDMIQAAVTEALSKEAERQKKVDEKSATGVTKTPADKGDQKISTVQELDDLFANMDL
jgi:hypothetical protein